MSFILTFHRFAGILWHFNCSSRVVLGWVSLTFFPYDVDEAIEFFVECEDDTPID